MVRTEPFFVDRERAAELGFCLPVAALAQVARPQQAVGRADVLVTGAEHADVLLQQTLARRLCRRIIAVCERRLRLGEQLARARVVHLRGLRLADERNGAAKRQCAQHARRRPQLRDNAIRMLQGA